MTGQSHGSENRAQAGAESLAGELHSRLRFATVPALIVFSLAPHGKWGLLAGSLVLVAFVGAIMACLTLTQRGKAPTESRTIHGAVLEWMTYGVFLLIAHIGALAYSLLSA